MNKYNLYLLTVICILLSGCTTWNPWGTGKSHKYCHIVTDNQIKLLNCKIIKKFTELFLISANFLLTNYI